MTSDKVRTLIEIETTFGPILGFENDFISNQIVKFGAHTRPELAFLLSVVYPGDLIFDLGGHIGTFAIPLAQKIGSTGRLLAVEDSPEIFLVLQKNLKNAVLAAETVGLSALIARPGRHYKAHTPDGNTGGTMFLPTDFAGASIEPLTIDELCRHYFVPRILKIDIEGGEYHALAGSDLLSRRRPIIFTEVNGRLLNMQGASIKQMNEVLCCNGYRLFRNAGQRNAAHDIFVPTELKELPSGINNYDVLAIHRADERLELIVRSMESK